MKVFIFLFVLIFCMGCSEDKTESLKTLEIVSVKVDSLDVSNLNISLTYALQYPDSKYIFLTNSNLEDSIKIYSLNTETYNLESILEISTISDFQAYYADELNSLIYLFLDEEIAIYDFQNRLIKRQSFGEIEDGYLTSLKPTSFYPYVQAEKIHIEFFPDIEKSYADPKFYQFPFQVVYNLETDEVTYLEMHYPQEYKDKCYGYNFIPDRILTKDNIQVASFPYNDSAYIYNSKGKLIDVKYFGTRVEHSFQYIPFEGIEELQREVFDDFYTNMPFYGLPQYIPFSEIYVRNYYTFDKVKNTLNTTIIFYDINWQYLGEVKSDKGQTFFGSQEDGLISLKIKNDTLEIYEVKF